MSIPRHFRILGALAIAFQIYNIVGVGQSWPYLFGILTLLINGFSVFLVLVFKLLDSEDQPNKMLEPDAWRLSSLRYGSGQSPH